MKHLFFAIAMLFGVMVAEAQIQIPSTSSVTKEVENAVNKSITPPPPIGDINKTTSSIVSNLITSLALGQDKKTALTGAVSSFLKSKSSFIGLAKSDPTKYLQKFAPAQKGLFDKLQPILGATSYSKFLGLKPSTSSATNLLGNLFY